MSKKDNKKKVEPPKKKCVGCERNVSPANFYNSNNTMFSDGKTPLCKKCVKERINYKEINTIYDVLRQLDIAYVKDYWDTAVASEKDTFGVYMRMANTLSQLKGKSWSDSDFESRENNTSTIKENKEIVIKEKPIEEHVVSESEDKNKEDVLRMLGYDPFESEIESDKRYLYNRLVDYLDESTLEDSFKLPAVIEIVKTFNQVDKINRALSVATSDIDSLVQKSGTITSLINSKEKMLKSVLALAKDNGISVNNNNNKSKGAGTLSGIIKTLQEKGFEQGEVNLFDVETAQGMRQVADLSNQSIVSQLQFDENDYTEMIVEQKEMIGELEKKVMNLEEENRLLKKELMKLQKYNN